MGPPCTNRTAAIHFIRSWWDCPAQTGQLQYTSSGLGGTALHKQDSCNTLHQVLVGLPCTNRTAAIHFIRSWWDCPAQIGQLQYTSSGLGGTALHKQDSCNTLHQVLVGLPCTNRTAAIHFIRSWWDLPAQTGQLQYTSSGLGGTRFVTAHGNPPPPPPIECLDTLKSLLLTYYQNTVSHLLCSTPGC